MKCFRLRCYVNNSFLVFHQGTKHSKTIKHSRFALVFHTVFSCLDPLMKHSNSLFTYNVKTLSRMPEQPRQFHSTQLFDDNLLIVGGNTSDRYQDNLSSVVLYDIKKNECKHLAPLPYEVSEMATVRW